MAELEQWTNADEDLVRGALATLRPVEPLAGPAEVRSRGDQRRRTTYAVWGAGLAAAAAVVVTLAVSGLGSKSAEGPFVPGTSTSASATATDLVTRCAAGPTPVATCLTETPPAKPTLSATTIPANGTPSVTGSPATPSGADRPAVLNVSGMAIPESLFLRTSEWRSAFGPVLPAVSNVPSSVEGFGVAACDPIHAQGEYATSYVTSGAYDIVGEQRVQVTNLQSDSGTNDAEPTAIIRGFLGRKACAQIAGSTDTVELGPDPNTVAVTSTCEGCVRSSTTLVGAVALRGDANTATIALFAFDDDPAAGWAALRKLMAAAATH